jgi:hypothetical protein
VQKPHLKMSLNCEKTKTSGEGAVSTVNTKPNLEKRKQKRKRQKSNNMDEKEEETRQYDSDESDGGSDGENWDEIMKIMVEAGKKERAQTEKEAISKGAAEAQKLMNKTRNEPLIAILWAYHKVLNPKPSPVTIWKALEFDVYKPKEMIQAIKIKGLRAEISLFDSRDYASALENVVHTGARIATALGLDEIRIKRLLDYHFVMVRVMGFPLGTKEELINYSLFKMCNLPKEDLLRIETDKTPNGNGQIFLRYRKMQPYFINRMMELVVIKKKMLQERKKSGRKDPAALSVTMLGDTLELRWDLPLPVKAYQKPCSYCKKMLRGYEIDLYHKEKLCSLPEMNPKCKRREPQKGELNFDDWDDSFFRKITVEKSAHMRTSRAQNEAEADKLYFKSKGAYREKDKEDFLGSESQDGNKRKRKERTEDPKDPNTGQPGQQPAWSPKDSTGISPNSSLYPDPSRGRDEWQSTHDGSAEGEDDITGTGAFETFSQTYSPADYGPDFQKLDEASEMQ